MESDEFGWNVPVLRSKTVSILKLVGDALYGISNGSVYVSRDTARTWNIDTAGVGTNYTYDIEVDTLQYAYLANSVGLFKQHPDSSIWRKVSSFPGTFSDAVFADRKNRLLATAFNKIYLSTNSGATWSIDTAGLNKQNVTGFCDDAFGNIYARNATRLWRSTGGTQSWVRIDQPVSGLAHDPSTTPIFNDLEGDSLLYASTVYGVYQSSDKGSIWSADTAAFAAQSIYGLVKTPAGRLLTSTSLGIYYKDVGSTQWTKTFPPSGYIAACPIFRDGAGNLYTLGAIVDPSNTLSLRRNWKSTDGGFTWSADTAGLPRSNGQLQAYYVDETGVQHCGAFDSPAKFYRKASGQSWTADTTGYGSNSQEYPTVFASDRRGNLFVATINLFNGAGAVWKRPIAGGTWTADTTGLGGTPVYSITVDKAGNQILGAINGVFRKSGSSWVKVPSPPGRDGYSAFVVSADSSGNTIAGFSISNGRYLWRGIYATKNNGATWTYLGLDSISVRGLVSYGDTTYAFTYVDGLYKLRTQSTGVSDNTVKLPAQFALSQNYPNPFNPTTVISYHVPAGQAGLPVNNKVTLKVFDVLGREVATLVNEKKDAGVYSVRFDGSGLPSGVYFYRLQAGDFSRTRKLLLLK